MKIVYIAHPIGGNVVRNLEALAGVLREINLAEPEVVPLAPYFGDVLALDDNNPAERARGLENGRTVLKSGAIREVWLYGDGVSPGMLGEVRLAEALGLPIVPKTAGTRAAYNALIAEGALDKPVRGEKPVPKQECKHQNRTQHFSDVFGPYQSCKDCGRDL